MRHKIVTGVDSDETKFLLQVETIDSNQTLHQPIVFYLGCFEDISIGVQANLLDEQILYDSLHGFARFTHQRLKPDILNRQKQSKTFYCEFEKLVAQWNDGKLLSTSQAGMSAEKS